MSVANGEGDRPGDSARVVEGATPADQDWRLTGKVWYRPLRHGAYSRRATSPSLRDREETGC